MLNQPTIEKLYSLKLFGMAEAVRRQMEDPEISRLSFDERLALLVDQQWDWRQNKALARRLKNARFKIDAAVEDIDSRHPRRLDRQLIRTLSGCDWVRLHHNLLVTGPCGVGKSFIACALAPKAVREGFTALSGAASFPGSGCCSRRRQLRQIAGSFCTHRRLDCR